MALNAAGISSITIVRGYHGKRLTRSVKTYPHLAFIDNPGGRRQNKYPSIALAGRAGLLADSYVIEGDLYLANPAITPMQTRTNYIAFSVESTDVTGVLIRMRRARSRTLTQAAHIPAIRCSGCPTGQRRMERGSRLVRMRSTPRKSIRQLYWDEIMLKYHLHECDVASGSVRGRTCGRSIRWRSCGNLRSWMRRNSASRRCGGSGERSEPIGAPVGNEVFLRENIPFAQSASSTMLRMDPLPAAGEA